MKSIRLFVAGTSLALAAGGAAAANTADPVALAAVDALAKACVKIDREINPRVFYQASQFADWPSAELDLLRATAAYAPSLASAEARLAREKRDTLEDQCEAAVRKAAELAKGSDVPWKGFYSR